MTTPTQVAHPWRATARTAAAVAVGALTALVAVLPIVQDFVEAVAPGSPVVAWIAGATVVVASLSAAVTRIMALSAVNDLLARFGLGAQPKGE